MFRWTPYTFVRIVLFFVSGIILGIYLPGGIDLDTAIFFLTVLTFFYLAAYGIFRFRKKSIFNLGMLALPAVFLAGYVHVTVRTESRHPDHIMTVNAPVKFYEAVITRYAEERERSWKVEARVLSVFTTEWYQKTGKIILYLSKQDYKTPFAYGDKLLIRGWPALVPPSPNPDEFDYKRFLSFRNIHHQHFLRGNDIKLTGNDPPNPVLKYAINARMWADRTLKRFVAGEREQAIASALVLGVTDGLDNELLNAYAATGAMHVLAVSGLHISIIYMIILWLLKPLHKFRSGPWILAIAGLILLWTYAFITGWSPSVLRAVTMFTFIALARPTLQSTNIYNTLAASAFCLLMFDPYLIMSVGFQLSYLAVLGIVYLQPRFYKLWEPRTWLTDQVWKITCVSIAAQIATFVLGVLYFHQFPNYFLLSNLLVIPISFGVLVAGLAVLAFSFVHALASILGFLLMMLIRLLNLMVFIVEAFPYSLIEDIHITTLQCWLLMAVIICFMLMIEHKRFYFNFWALAFISGFTFLQWNHFRDKVNIQKITVYNVRGHSAIDLIDRGRTYFITDSILYADADRIRFHVRPNRLSSGIREVIAAKKQPFIREFTGGKVISWKKNLIVHITDREFILPSGIRPDYIFIGNNAVEDLTMIEGSVNRAIILDSSNSFYYSQRLMQAASALNLRVHSVLHHGAFDHRIVYTDS